VLHAVRKIEALVTKDVALSEEVESLKQQLYGAPVEVRSFEVSAPTAVGILCFLSQTKVKLRSAFTEIIKRYLDGDADLCADDDRQFGT